MENISDKIDKLKRWWSEEAGPLEAHTSGSTGSPKRILLPRELALVSARRSVRHFGLTPNSVIHLMLSPDYIAGKMAVIRALEAGCTLTWEEASSHPLRGEDKPENITLLPAVGSQVEGMAELKAAGRLSHVEHLLLGGAPLNSEMRHAAVMLADNVWESYGMTETASHVALRRLNREKPDDVPAFTPLPGISVSLDERGCLVVESVETGRLVTNDLAEMTEDGGFRIIGRADNVIITGGLKVIPEKIEEQLRHFLPGKEFYIAARPHIKWGNELILIVEAPEEEMERFVECDEMLYGATPLSQILKNEFKPHERPRQVLLVPQLERTSTGKIKRRKLL